jgi:hypothetical protein
VQLYRYFLSQSSEFCRYVTLCVAYQRVFVVVYFVIDSVRKLLDIPSYASRLCASETEEGYKVAGSAARKEFDLYPSRRTETGCGIQKQ